MIHSINTQTRSWLAFVEDPGAAVYISSLPKALQDEGVNCRVIATGHALEVLARKGIAAERLSPEATGVAMLEVYKPSLVIVGTSENPDSFSFDLIETARARGITTVGIVDAAANVAERFRGRGDHQLSFAPDWLVVPDEETAKEFRKLGFPAGQVQACGHPQYDEVLALRSKWSEQDRLRQREKWLPAAGQGRPALMFISELSTGLNAQQFRRSTAYTLQGRPESDGRTEIVLDELLMAIQDMPEKPYLVLRLHPKQGQDDLPRHRRLFDQVSRSEPALELVNAADAIVGMTSMLLLESALLGRPTLSLVPRAEERAWLGPMASAIPCVWTRGDLLRVLPQAFAGDGVCGEPLVPYGSREKVIEFFREHFA
jgi:hypothetical protein